MGKSKNTKELSGYWICENREKCKAPLTTCEPHGSIHKQNENCLGCSCEGKHGSIKGSLCREMTFIEYTIYRLKGNEK